MQSNREILFCHYHYDPLDRVVGCTPFAQARTERFYLKDRMTTEIQSSVQCSIMQHVDGLLALQLCLGGKLENHLLATDQQRSVLSMLDETQPHSFTYTPYGHRPSENGLLCLLGFNGERPDEVTGHYLLGLGYRAFNPVLMRFNSPDSWSPFGRGGVNAYAYCVGDPVNREDSNGRISKPLPLVKKETPQIAAIKRASTFYGVRSPSSKRAGRSVSVPVSQSEAQDSSDFTKIQYPMPTAEDQLFTADPEPGIPFGPENLRVNEVENFIILEPRTLFHSARSALKANQTHLLGAAVENPSLRIKLQSVATFNTFIKNFKKSELHLERVLSNQSIEYLPSDLQKIIRQ